SLAEGQGRNAVFLAQQGHDVLGVDGSEVGLARARSLAESRGVEIATRVVDLADFEIEPSHYAGIISIFAHVPRELRRSLHRRVVSGLRPGGVFLLEAYSPKQLGMGTGGPPDLERLFDLDEVKGELDGLTIEHGVETKRAVVEGRFHTGDAWVTQILARRP
ncbi:MAG: class I SAM-dependent methyltransferase, partial [Acidobacteriota bacterium]